MPAHDAPEKPLGLLDLWRVRRSFVYRTERRSLRARRGLIWGVAMPTLGIAFFAICAFLPIVLVHAPDESVLIIRHVILAMFLCSACVAGVRTFTAELTSGTLDALAMTPLSRQELVLGRFCARVAPHAVCFLIFFAICLIELLYWFIVNPVILEIGYYNTVTLPWRYSLLYVAAMLGFWAYYCAAALLGAALGLYTSLRFRSVVGALAATLGSIFLSCAFFYKVFSLIQEKVVALLCFGDAWGADVAEWERAVAWSQGASAIVYGPLCIVFLLLARALLRRAARNFDEWATRD